MLLLLGEATQATGHIGSCSLHTLEMKQVMDVDGVGLKDLRGEALEFMRTTSDLMQVRQKRCDCWKTVYRRRRDELT